MLATLLVVVIVCTILYVALQRRGGRMLGMFYVPARGTYADVYTYDGRVLRRIKVGRPFEMVVMPGTQTMTSIYTGTEWSGTGCLSYMGQKVGFVGASYFNRALSELAEKHKHVRVWATVTGYSSGGWPIIRLDLPKSAWFKEELEKN